MTREKMGTLSDDPTPLPPDLLITVCADCDRASCWQGLFFCDNARMAGIHEMPVKELRRMRLEHSDYWEHDPNAIEWRRVHGTRTTEKSERRQA